MIWDYSRILQGDRFIPDRSSMDFDMARYLLTEGRKEKENTAVSSPSKEAYRKQLAETLMMNRTRILAFKSKPPTPVEGVFQESSSDSVSTAQIRAAKPRRYIPQVSFPSFSFFLFFNNSSVSLGF